MFQMCVLVEGADALTNLQLVVCSEYAPELTTEQPLQRLWELSRIAYR